VSLLKYFIFICDCSLLAEHGPMHSNKLEKKYLRIRNHDTK
jgi:hypothetical protein